MAPDDTGDQQENYLGPERRSKNFRDRGVNDDPPTTGSRLRRLFRSLDRAGFDPDDDEAMDRWADQQRHADLIATRREARARRSGRAGWIIAATVAGGIGTNLTGLGRWLIHLLPSALWSGPPPTP